MTLEELLDTEAKIAALREEREICNQARLNARAQAREISRHMRELEQTLPPKRIRNQMKRNAPKREDQTLSIEPATVKVAPKKR